MDNIRKHLTGNKLVDISRYGKYLFLKINDGYFLVWHFGMTGEVSYYKKEEPDHIAMILKLENGYNLSAISVRKLGLIDIVKEKSEIIKRKNLGPDANSTSKDEFIKIIQKSGGYIKTFLMDQSNVCGLGNVYTDEILYQAKLHPKQKINKISDEEMEELYEIMKDVLKNAIKNDAKREKMPNYYLIERRDPSQNCGICSGRIEKIKVGGRSTYFCGKHQKLKGD